jgi:hypothetical protein
MFAINAVLAGMFGLLMLTEDPFSAWADENYQAYYLFLGNDPDELESDWSSDAQGLTHDDAHWYITQTEDIWRVPVSMNLNNLATNTPGVQRRRLNDVPQLMMDGYNHFGDPSDFLFQGQGYVIVPIEQIDGDPPPLKTGVVVFRGDETLEYVDHVTINTQVNNLPQVNNLQEHAPWCGVDQLGRIYSSNYNDVNRLFRYRVDWPELVQSGTLNIQFDLSIDLLAENGDTLALDGVQGGVFTDDDQRLYMVANGIHVFDTSSWRRVQISQNGAGYFNYEFHDSFDEEPEGITIWDLENTASPHRGELHVMLLDNDDGNDDIYIKHYTGTIDVDATNTGEQDGTPEQPFRAVKAAADLAWDGAEISIRANVYPESIAILKAVRVVAKGGTVGIGE